MNIWHITSAFPKNHFPITPSDSTPLPRPMIVVALTDGNVSITDDNGTTIVYAVTAGWNSYIVAHLVGEDTTSEVIGVY